MPRIHQTSILGGVLAFILSLSCCWLPALIIGIGGASSMMAFSSTLEQYSGVLMGLGAILLIYGGYKFYESRTVSNEIRSHSLITCPKCNHATREEMPTDACQYFYECKKCKTILKPLKGDCCVYCSYGDTNCPPIQQGELCCE